VGGHSARLEILSEAGSLTIRRCDECFPTYANYNTAEWSLRRLGLDRISEQDEKKEGERKSYREG